MKVDIPLYEGAEVVPKFDFVHCLFHTSEITGLDICIRKQLIVTSSNDKSIKIWNYANKTMEISYYTQDDPLAVAFHPSGFHLIVALKDKLNLMNVLSKSLHPFKQLQSIKMCKEIQFANGGHLFAAANGPIVQIYNFYTGELLIQCKGHTQKVRSIHWFNDDMGFASCGMGGDVYFWDLINAKENGYKI